MFLRTVGTSRWISRILLPLLALAAVMAAAPGVASASTLKITSTRVEYNAAAGETNQLTIVRSGGNFVFTEAGTVVITVTPPCVSILPRSGYRRH